MKSDGGCWRLRLAVPLVAMLWLTGCGMDGSNADVLCPPVVPYSAADQARAAAEVTTLPEGAVVIRMLSDYAVLRDQARACG